MKSQRLREDISIEFEQMQATIAVIEVYHRSQASQAMESMAKAGAALSLVNIYNGMENIFKRIVKFYHVPLPVGGSTHAELFELFCTDTHHSLLPVLISDTIRPQCIALRKMRHYVMHGYAFKLDEDRIRIALGEISPLYASFKSEVENFLSTLPPE
jgi:hypothetical protein